ncbi:unnamed protein product [Calicophoron daubneyi]|uniref:Uncharacterized protein n=1 Tax=Calicophoron daubneyi TaxID=300641 RepID=A0AAV2TL23_CALDB
MKSKDFPRVMDGRDLFGPTTCAMYRALSNVRPVKSLWTVLRRPAVTSAGNLKGERVSADGQIKYSTNKKWHAAMNFLQKPRDVPSYQYPVVLLSALVCLVYFCFLREENELDEILAGKLTVQDVYKNE